ncbi:hypothetical protein OKW33_003396 [Paraburkholderia atlantica]
MHSAHVDRAGPTCLAITLKSTLATCQCLDASETKLPNGSIAYLMHFVRRPVSEDRPGSSCHFVCQGYRHYICWASHLHRLSKRLVPWCDTAQTAAHVSTTYAGTGRHASIHRMEQPGSASAPAPTIVPESSRPRMRGAPAARWILAEALNHVRTIDAGRSESPLYRTHGDAGHDAPLEHDVKHDDRRRGQHKTRAQQRNIRRIFAAQCGDTDH